MAFDTINERISALNVSTFGLLAGLFIPLQASGAITTDDAENALGYYIGTDVEITEEFVPPTSNFYSDRFLWRRLGKSRDRVYRIMVSDAVKWVITAAYIESERTPGRIGHDPDGMVWRRLGKSRDRVYRITATDAVKWVISTAFVEAE